MNKLRSRFAKHPVIVGKHISLAINKTIDDIIDKTKPITPVDSGRLVGSFTLDSIRSRTTSLAGAVRSLVPYAASVHDLHPAGSRYFNPTKNKVAVAGFLKVGAERAERQINKNFQDALDNITKALGN